MVTQINSEWTNKMPAISVIIPIYNVEKYLPRCLDSVLNQTFSDWEAICVNDGSPDKSDKILEKYSSRDKRFKIVNKTNGGLSDARNAGLNKATGKYILYLDSDDFIHPQTFEILTSFADKNNADMVVFNIDDLATKKMTQALQGGADISTVLPATYNKRYKLNRIASRVTDNILFYSTEKNHTFGSFKVRHCYPVLKMLDRKLAMQHKFIKNIIIEEFPWWSSVMLSRPRTVIIKAPLYFYTPNITSILHSSKSVRMITSIFKGLDAVYKLYETNATLAEKKYYARNFLWPFVIIAWRKFGSLEDKSDITIVRKELSKLYNKGVFDNPPTRRARKYKHRIENFISQSF